MGEINEILIQSSQHLVDVVHTFKILREEYETSVQYKWKNNDNDISIHRKGIIWIIKTYSPWQNVILTMMKEIYLVSHYDDSICNDYFFLRINIFVTEKWK